MKKEFLTGLTAMVLAIGLALAGCESPTNGSNGGPGNPGNPGAIVGTAGTLDGLKAFLAENASGTFYYVGNEALETGDTLTIGDGQVVVVIPFNELNGRAAAPANPAVAGITLDGGTLTVGGGASGRLKVDKGASLTVTSGVFNAAAASFVAIADGASFSLAAPAAVTYDVEANAVFAFENPAALTAAVLEAIIATGGGKVLPGSIDPDDAGAAKPADEIALAPDPEGEDPIEYEDKTLVLAADLSFADGALTLKAGAYSFTGTSGIDPATGELTIGSTLTLTGGAKIIAGSLAVFGDSAANHATAIAKVTGDIDVTAETVEIAAAFDIDTTYTGTLTFKNLIVKSGNAALSLGAGGKLKADTLKVYASTASAPATDIVLNGVETNGGAAVVITSDTNSSIVLTGKSATDHNALKITGGTVGNAANAITFAAGEYASSVDNKLVTIGGGSAIKLAITDTAALIAGGAITFGGSSVVTTLAAGTYTAAGTGDAGITGAGAITIGGTSLSLSDGAEITTNAASLDVANAVKVVKGTVNFTNLYTASGSLILVPAAGSTVTLNFKGGLATGTGAFGGTSSKTFTFQVGLTLDKTEAAYYPTLVVVNGGSTTLTLGKDAALGSTETLALGVGAVLDTGSYSLKTGTGAIGKGSAEWTFSKSGGTTLPAGTKFEAASGGTILTLTSDLGGSTSGNGEYLGSSNITLKPGAYTATGGTVTFANTTGAVTISSTLTLPTQTVATDAALITTITGVDAGNLVKITSGVVQYTDEVTLGAALEVAPAAGKTVTVDFAGGLKTHTSAVNIGVSGAGVSLGGSGNVSVGAAKLVAVQSPASVTLTLGAQSGTTSYTLAGDATILAATLVIPANVTLVAGASLGAGTYTHVGASGIVVTQSSGNIAAGGTSASFGGTVTTEGTITTEATGGTVFNGDVTASSGNLTFTKAATFNGDLKLTKTPGSQTFTGAANEAITLANGKSIYIGTAAILTAGGSGTEGAAGPDLVLTPGGGTVFTATDDSTFTGTVHNITVTSGVLKIESGKKYVCAGAAANAGDLIIANSASLDLSGTVVLTGTATTQAGTLLLGGTANKSTKIAAAATNNAAGEVTTANVTAAGSKVTITLPAGTGSSASDNGSVVVGISGSTQGSIVTGGNKTTSIVSTDYVSAAAINDTAGPVPGNGSGGLGLGVSIVGTVITVGNNGSLAAPDA